MPTSPVARRNLSSNVPPIQIVSTWLPCVNGWKLDTGTDPPTIELLGETCEKVETEGVQSVEVLFGCPTIVG